MPSNSAGTESAPVCLTDSMKIQMVKGQLMILARTKYSSQNQQALRLERLCCPLLQALGYVWSKTERECMCNGVWREAGYGAEEVTRPEALTRGCPISQHKENCCQDPKMGKCIEVSQENCCLSSITVQPWRSHGSSFASVLFL